MGWAGKILWMVAKEKDRNARQEVVNLFFSEERCSTKPGETGRRTLKPRDRLIVVQKHHDSKPCRKAARKVVSALPDGAHGADRFQEETRGIGCTAPNRQGSGAVARVYC